MTIFTKRILKKKRLLKKISLKEQESLFNLLSHYIIIIRILRNSKSS